MLQEATALSDCCRIRRNLGVLHNATKLWKYCRIRQNWRKCKIWRNVKVVVSNVTRIRVGIEPYKVWNYCRMQRELELLLNPMKFPCAAGSDEILVALQCPTNSDSVAECVKNWRWCKIRQNLEVVQNLTKIRGGAKFDKIRGSAECSEY